MSELRARVPDGHGGYVERTVEVPPKVEEFLACGQVDGVSIDDGLEPIEVGPLLGPGLRESLRTFWRRLRCDHEWVPVGFADFYCRKCGADR